MTYQQARHFAKRITGRTPRWCDVRDENDELAPAPTPEAMDDCLAMDSNGLETQIDHWLNQQPRGKNVEAVCYF